MSTKLSSVYITFLISSALPTLWENLLLFYSVVTKSTIDLDSKRQPYQTWVINIKLISSTCLRNRLAPREISCDYFLAYFIVSYGLAIIYLTLISCKKFKCPRWNFTYFSREKKNKYKNVQPYCSNSLFPFITALYGRGKSQVCLYSNVASSCRYLGADTQLYNFNCSSF